MAASTFESILKDLKKKVYYPVYFLQGEEPYYIDEIASFIEANVLSESEKEFNQTIVYGRDTDPASIFSMARRYPMMSNYQVVIVREAQDIKNLFRRKSNDDDTGASSDDNDPFIKYLTNPQKSTVLVFCYKYKKIDKRTRVSKLLDKNGLVFEAKKLYDNQIPGWVDAYVKSNGFRITEGASRLISEYLGTELSKLSNELDKLIINLPANGTITAESIEQNIGISKDYNVFELQNAIGSRDYQKVLRIVNYFGANPKSNPIVLTLSTLNGFFNKLITYHAMKGKPGVNIASALGINPYFQKDYDKAARNFSLQDSIRAINMLHEYDLRSKGVNNYSTSDNELLKELLYKIMHQTVMVL